MPLAWQEHGIGVTAEEPVGHPQLALGRAGQVLGIPGPHELLIS